MNNARAYLLGFHLGDGCLTSGSRGQLGAKYSTSDEDEDLLKHVQSILDWEFKTRPSIRHIPEKHVYLLVSEKHDLCDWLLATVGRDKRWPDGMRDWSREARYFFVAGLMDADGFVSIQRNHKYWSKKNKKEYTQSFKCLVGFCNTAPWFVDFISLVQSLGGSTGRVQSITTSGKRGFKRTTPLYRVYIQPNSFISSGFFFLSKRKMGKIREIMKERGLSSPSETTRRALQL